MEKLTYKEAEALIFDAYFKDEIKPLDSEFCFCGTLSPDRFWTSVGILGSHKGVTGENYPYSLYEYGRMEKKLFSSFPDDIIYCCIGTVNIKETVNSNNFLNKVDNYEEKLFEGMCAALEELKNIHRERGEDVDDIPLKRRELVTV